MRNFDVVMIFIDYFLLQFSEKLFEIEFRKKFQSFFKYDN